MRPIVCCIIGFGFLLVAPHAGAQPKIHALTGIIENHEVGGVSVDMTGFIYAADFGDIVWRITPEGERSVFASGFYGAAGNAIDGKGNLLQTSYYADEIIKVDRSGTATLFVSSGLNNPAGIVFNKKSGEMFVTNCGNNSVVKVSSEGAVSPYAKSDLFNCPYGTALDRSGNLYVVNYSDNKMLKVDRKGDVSLFAEVSQNGLTHLCFKSDRFFVAAFRSNAIYEVMLNGDVKRILGNGERALTDGAGENARLSSPFGVGCHPWAPRIYVNEEIGVEGAPPRRSTIRVITLGE